MFPELILRRTSSGGQSGYTSEGAISKMGGGLVNQCGVLHLEVSNLLM